MSVAPSSIAAVLLGYLAGAVPFGYLLVRVRRGIDLRTVGSGNIGATNVARALGTPWACLVYALDAAKGFAAVRVLPVLFGIGDAALPVFCGVAAVLGHCFPVFLGFRGGKGAATVSGVLLALEPVAFAAGAVVWLAALALFRFVSVASIGMALAYPVVVVALDPEGALGRRAPLAAASFALAVLVIVRHRENLRRLLRGSEPRIGRRSPSPGGAKE